jgi:hypothetical protein
MRSNEKVPKDLVGKGWLSKEDGHSNPFHLAPVLPSAELQQLAVRVLVLSVVGWCI